MALTARAPRLFSTEWADKRTIEFVHKQKEHVAAEAESGAYETVVVSGRTIVASASGLLQAGSGLSAEGAEPEALRSCCQQAARRAGGDKKFRRGFDKSAAGGEQAGAREGNFSGIGFVARLRRREGGASGEALRAQAHTDFRSSRGDRPETAALSKHGVEISGADRIALAARPAHAYRHDGFYPDEERRIRRSPARSAPNGPREFVAPRAATRGRRQGGPQPAHEEDQENYQIKN